MAALMGSLVSLCVGSTYAKTLFPALGAEGVSALRIGLAMLMLMAVFRPWRRRWQSTDLAPLALYGVTLGLMNLLFYKAIERVPVGLTIALEFIGPLSVALWNSRHARDWLWVALVAIGMGLVLPLQGLDTPGALDPIGIGFALAAAVCWALYIVFGQRVARRYGRDATPMGMLAGALVVVPFGAFQAGNALLDAQWWLPGLAVALLSSALPYALEMYALNHLPKQTFSILLSLEPVIGAVTGWLMLAEALSQQQLLAMALIVTASMGSAWGAQSAAPAVD
jgi:inner membrane transporter RhtA